MRAFYITHILDDAENFYIHHRSHFYGFFDYHRNEILRGCNDNYSVDRQRLKYRERNVARPRRHVDEHIVYVAPHHVGIKLFDRSADYRSAPNHGVAFFGQKQVHRHNFYALSRFYGIYSASVFGSHRLIFYAESLRNGRTRDIRVEYRHLIAFTKRRDRQKVGYHRFTHAALTAYDGYHFADTRIVSRRFYKIFFLAGFAARRTIVITIAHFYSFIIFPFSI